MAGNIYTLKILVNDTASLDGFTPIGSDAKVSVDEETGVIEVDIPAGTPFGMFDPGQLTSLQDKTFMLVAADVISVPAMHAAGSNISIESPPGVGAPPKSRVVVDLAMSGALGIEQKIFRTVIPVAHKLTFDTTPDGVATGPTTVQLGLVVLNDRTLFASDPPGVGITVQAGRNGNTAAGAFYRSINGMTLNAGARGIPVPAGTLSFVGWTRTNAAGSPVLEVLNNGSVIATLTNPGAGVVFSTPNVDVVEGLLSFRNQITSGVTTRNVQITASVS